MKVVFDKQRLVSDAGLLLTATLAERLGLEQVVNDSLWLRYRTPGAALPGRKVMSLVHGMLPLVIDIDSFIGEVHGDHKQGASYGYTRQRSSGITPSRRSALTPGKCCTSATAGGRPTPSAVRPGSSMSCSRGFVVPAMSGGS